MRPIALGFAAVALAACAPLPFGGGPNEDDDFSVPLVCEPKLERIPCGAGVVQGRPYRFNLLTHCGIEWAYFDGRYWVPGRRVDTPPQWANIEAGTMMLERQDEAVFEAGKGGGARFVPAGPGYVPEVCA